MEKLDSEITNTDIFKLTFAESFYDFFGGYLPSGQLGTCTVQAYNNETNSLGEYNGKVYFYNDIIKIIPDDENYPSNKFWYDGLFDVESGIVSLSIEFEIQVTKPDYVDLILYADDKENNTGGDIIIGTIPGTEIGPVGRG